MSVRVFPLADERCELLCLDLPRAEQLRAGRLNREAAKTLAAGARALADPTRLTLALALRESGELCVCDLSWIVERSQALVSHHLRSLRGAGLVRSRRDGKMVMYELTDEGSALLEALVVPAEIST
jgi:ArsR family transcriptional regulator, lead/cadmium/zinc/bismuth-responsive transcriptional repressor